MAKLLKNNAESTLASTASAVATTLTVVDGSVFPSPGSDTFLLTLTQGSGLETSWEVVLCTARTGNDLTVVRAQEGTTAVEWIAGSKVSMRLTAGFFGGSDAALSDSREWTAETVEQAEAEAGTATTRRAWTAQRVWQAIAAYISTNVASIRTLLGVRDQLTADRTYYVRNDGDDNNDGLTNSSGGAFKTILKALQVAASLEIGAHLVTIRLADGTYDDTTLDFPFSGNVILVGNVANPENVYIGTFTVSGPFSAIKIDGVCARQIFVNTFATVNLDDANIAFQSPTGGGGAGRQRIRILQSKVRAERATIRLFGPDSHQNIVSAGNAAFASFFSTAFHIEGSPTWGNSAISCTSLSYVNLASASFSGSASGTRFLVAQNSVLRTNTGNPDFIPGTVAGTIETGGVYL